MKIDDLIEALTAVRKERGNLELVASTDDEGNGFRALGYQPTVGYFNEEDGEFYDESAMEEIKDDSDYNEEELKDFCVNSVCVN